MKVPILGSDSVKASSAITTGLPAVTATAEASTTAIEIGTDVVPFFISA